MNVVTNVLKDGSITDLSGYVVKVEDAAEAYAAMKGIENDFELRRNQESKRNDHNNGD